MATLMDVVAARLRLGMDTTLGRRIASGGIAVGIFVVGMIVMVVLCHTQTPRNGLRADQPLDGLGGLGDHSV